MPGFRKTIVQMCIFFQKIILMNFLQILPYPRTLSITLNFYMMLLKSLKRRTTMLQTKFTDHRLLLRKTSRKWRSIQKMLFAIFLKQNKKRKRQINERWRHSAMNRLLIFTDSIFPTKGMPRHLSLLGVDHKLNLEHRVR